MNQLRDLIYGRDSRASNSSNRVITSPTTNDLATENLSELLVEKDPMHHVLTKKRRKDVTSLEDPLVSDSRLYNMLLKVVPLQEGDCLGCKLVGTSAMAVSGVIVLTSAMVARNRNPNLIGTNPFLYNAVCGFMFLGFEAAAVVRFFDMGPFKPKAGVEDISD